jgi:hypothetical protein
MTGARTLVRRGFALDAFCLPIPEFREIAWTALFVDYIFTKTSISNINALRWSIEELTEATKEFIPHFEVVTGAYLEDEHCDLPKDVLFPAAVAICQPDFHSATSIDYKLELTMTMQKLMPALPSPNRLKDVAEQLVSALEYIVHAFEGRSFITGHDNSPLPELNLIPTIYLTRYISSDDHLVPNMFPGSCAVETLSPLMYGYRHAFDDDPVSRTEEFESQMQALITLWVTSVCERQKRFRRKINPHSFLSYQSGIIPFHVQLPSQSLFACSLFYFQSQSLACSRYWPLSGTF